VGQDPLNKALVLLNKGDDGLAVVLRDVLGLVLDPSTIRWPFKLAVIGRVVVLLG
jgi:hypothetical protein